MCCLAACEEGCQKASIARTLMSAPHVFWQLSHSTVPTAYIAHALALLSYVSDDVHKWSEEPSAMKSSFCPSGISSMSPRPARLRNMSYIWPEDGMNQPEVLAGALYWLPSSFHAATAPNAL